MIENELLDIIFTGVQYHENLSNSPERINVEKSCGIYTE
jgi:hypothetical protein